MKLLDRYDCVVLGDHPGALLTCLILNRLGMAALVIPYCGSQSLTYSQDRNGVVDPEASYWLGISEHGKLKGLWNEVISKIDLPNLTLKQVTSGSKCTEVWFNHALFRLLSNLEGWEHECEWNEVQGRREFARLKNCFDQYALLFLKFWSEYPQRLSEADRRSAKKLSALLQQKFSIRSELFDSKPDGREPVSGTDKKFLLQSMSRLDSQSQRWLSAIWKTEFGNVGPAKDYFDELHALALSQVGEMLNGGVSAVREQFLAAAKEAGVHVLEKSTTLDFGIQGHKLSHLLLGEGKKRIEIGSLMMGCSMDQIKMVFQGKPPQSSLLQPVGWCFTLMIRVPSEVMDEPQARRVTIDQEGSPFLSIEFKTASEYKLVGNPDDWLLFVRTSMPFSSESIAPVFQKKIAKRMLGAVRQYYPNIEKKWTLVFPNPDNSLDREMSQAFGFPSLEYVPENLRQYADSGRGPQTTIPGVFVVSGESYPQLGTLGPIVAAVEASHWVAVQSGIGGVFG